MYLIFCRYESKTRTFIKIKVKYIFTKLLIFLIIFKSIFIYFQEIKFKDRNIYRKISSVKIENVKITLPLSIPKNRNIRVLFSLTQFILYMQRAVHLL